jgi:hypothetical protein
VNFNPFPRLWVLFFRFDRSPAGILTANPYLLFAIDFALTQAPVRGGCISHRRIKRGISFFLRAPLS